MGEVWRSGPRQREPQGRRPRGRAVHDRLRPLLLLPARAVVALRQLESERWMVEKLYGYRRLGPVRLLAHDRRLRRRPGRVRARAVRRRRADQGARSACADEQVLFLSDIFPTGYMAAENCNIQPGDTVAVWGCGPVGQFAIRERLLLGAERVIAIDRVPARLRMAARLGRRRDDRLRGGGRLRPPDGADRRTRPRRLHRRRRPGGARPTLDALYDRAKAAADPGHRPAARAAPGDPGLPQGRHGVDPRRLRRLPRQDPVRRGLRQGPDLQDGPDPRPEVPAAAARSRSSSGEIDPSFVITHRLPIDQAAEAYRTFRDNKDECIKVVLKPH